MACRVLDPRPKVGRGGVDGGLPGLRAPVLPSLCP